MNTWERRQFLVMILTGKRLVFVVECRRYLENLIGVIQVVSNFPPMNFTNTGEVRYEIGEGWKSTIVQQWCGMERDRGVVEDILRR